MSCEICGRSACCSSFHSLEEQSSFDEVADKVKERMSNVLSAQVNRLEGEYVDDVYYVKLDDVINIIDSY